MPSSATPRAQNDVEIDGEVARLTLRNRAGEVTGKALVDVANLERVRVFRWRLDKRRGVITRIPVSRKCLRLRRFLMGSPHDKRIYHVNGDPLDCRRVNLRVGSCADQNTDRDLPGVPSKTSSAVKGIYRSKSGKWIVYINHSGVRHSGGSFDRRQDAVAARRRLESALQAGHALPPPRRRVRQTQNDVELDGDIARVMLRDGYGNAVGTALIDAADWPTIQPHLWHNKSKGYVSARAGANGQWLNLPRFLLKPPKELLVLHQNKNRYDCRRANLELVTRQELTARVLSLGQILNNRSGRTGVQHMPTGKWYATLVREGVCYNNGSHDTFEAAVAARQELERLLVGPERDEAAIARFKPRTPLAPENEIERDGETVTMLLKNREAEVVDRALIDADDWETMRRYLWRTNAERDRVAAETKDGQNVRLARLLLNPQPGEVVYHLNGNPLDCRRINLRVGSWHDRSVNTLSKGPRASNSSGRVGVHWYRRGQRWQAYLTCHGRRYFGGAYKTFEEAVEARRQLELTHFGRILDPTD